MKLDTYTLFCGVFLFDQNVSIKNQEAVQWTNRLDRPQDYLEFLKGAYYEKYLDNIAPEASASGAIRHYTLGGFLKSPKGASCTLRGGSQLPVAIPYFDIYLFADGVGVFAFKAEPVNGSTSYEDVSNGINHIRNLKSVLVLDGKDITVLEFIRTNLDSVLQLRPDWASYIPQLKSYTFVNDPSAAVFDESLDRKLFELSHVLPIGSSVEPGNAPSETYYRSVLNNAVHVFDRWKVVSLFDTFTAVGCSFPDKFKSWEHESFFIYIHCLYTKFQLYYFNSQLKDIYTSSKKTTEIRGRFIEFVNDFKLAYISYKFLPNLLYEKVNQGLEVHKELEQMEQKIQRLNEAFHETKSRQTNRILLIISLLSILSVLTDLSQWLTNMGLSSQAVYSPVSVLSVLSMLGLIVFLAFRRK